jgi:DNA excision repair protein ERCC-2
VGKLVYCTRTVQEMDKVVTELRRISQYREEALRAEGLPTPPFLGVCLSSRRNLCIHPVVSQFDSRDRVDAMCRNMTMDFQRERRATDPTVEVCDFYEGYAAQEATMTLTGPLTGHAAGLRRSHCRC